MRSLASAHGPAVDHPAPGQADRRGQAVGVQGRQQLAAKHRCQGFVREHQPELGQQAANAVDASRTLCFETLAQAVDAQHALLLDGLDRHEVHLRSAGGLADGSSVVGVVPVLPCSR